MTKVLYLPIKPTIAAGEHADWTPAMRRCMDDGIQHRVIYAPDLFVTCEAPDPASVQEKARTAQKTIRAATVANVYVRYLRCTGNGVGVHVLVLRYGEDGRSTVYFAKTRGGGMDLLAHVMQGIPLYLPPGYDYVAPEMHRERFTARPPVILTDHCGLHQLAHPFQRDITSLTLKGDELQQLGYIVL